MLGVWKKVCCCCVAPFAVLLSCCTGNMTVEVCPSQPAGGVLPRGASIHVKRVEKGRGALALQRAFAARLKRDGYTVASAARGAYVLSVENVELRCIHVGAHAPIFTDLEKQRIYYERHFERVHNVPSHAELRATVVLQGQGYTLFRKIHRAFSVNSLRAKPNVDDVCSSFVAGLMKELKTAKAPCISLPVKADPAVPELEQAVRACRKGNLSQALELARAAHAQHPNLSEPVYMVGIVAWLHGDAGAASVLFRRAYKLQADTRYLKAAAQAAAAR